MKIDSFFKNTDLDRSLILGYYGGGNFGDELLLEVISHKLKENDAKEISVRYANLDAYSTFHHDFGFKLLDGLDIKTVIKNSIMQRNIIVGGGGFWGLDANRSVLLMSILLFICRFLFMKNIYIIGVGYYSSTTKLGHVAAFLAAKSANVLIVRDEESFNNFYKYNKLVSLDDDIAFQVSNKMMMQYKADEKNIESTVSVDGATIFITLRKFRGNAGKYNSLVYDIVASHPELSFIVGILQPAKEFPEGVELIDKLNRLTNVQVMPEKINPLALVLFFKKYSSKIKVISPQFHIIVTAMITGAVFMPISYDNKVSELLTEKKVNDILKIGDLKIHDLNSVISSWM